VTVFVFAKEGNALRRNTVRPNGNLIDRGLPETQIRKLRFNFVRDNALDDQPSNNRAHAKQQANDGQPLGPSRPTFLFCLLWGCH
jgi:hypothetical protein